MSDASGVFPVHYLLTHNAPLNAVVPVARVHYGTVPLNAAMPALSVMQVSAVERLTVAMENTPRMVTERVQITVLASTYLSQKTVMGLVRAALPVSRGTIDGIDVDSILPDSEGPDFSDPSIPLFTCSLDVFVRLNR